MENGLYTSDQLDWHSYCEIDRMNPSTLVHGCKSMLHLKHAIDHGVEPTQAMMVGAANHTLLLTPDEFASRHAVMPAFELDSGNVRKPKNKEERENPELCRTDSKATSYYKAKARQFYKDNEHKEVVTREEYDRCIAMSKAVHSKPAAKMWFDASRKEVAVLATLNGVDCKGRMDLVHSAAIVDVKTTSTVEPFAFGRTCANLRYLFRMAFYRGMVQAAGGGKKDVYFIAVEDKPPHDVCVFEVPEILVDNAAETVEQILEQYKKCRESGDWPGVDRGEDYCQLVVPNWAMDEDEELDWSGVDG